MKTKLTPGQVEVLLVKSLGDISDLEPIVEGEESQAFSFNSNGQSLIVRVNSDIEGFKKDAYAFSNFSSSRIPIPKVIKLEQSDSKHSLCISEKMPGITLQDADESTVQQLLKPVLQLWREIASTDISDSTGYGEFDGSGKGKSKTWNDFILLESSLDWSGLGDIVDKSLIEKVSNELQRASKFCPNEHKLVHGDFGSNNLLVDNNKVSAVLDWENAMYGDPLYDIATAYFWRTWLTCMEQTARYYEAELNSMPDYLERVRCYQLRIGLREIYVNARHEDIKMVKWLQNRTSEILQQHR